MASSQRDLPAADTWRPRESSADRDFVRGAASRRSAERGGASSPRRGHHDTTSKTSSHHLSGHHHPSSRPSRPRSRDRAAPRRRRSHSRARSSSPSSRLRGTANPTAIETTRPHPSSAEEASPLCPTAIPNAPSTGGAAAVSALHLGPAEPTHVNNVSEPGRQSTYAPRLEHHPPTPTNLRLAVAPALLNLDSTEKDPADAVLLQSAGLPVETSLRELILPSDTATSGSAQEKTIQGHTVKETLQIQLLGVQETTSHLGTRHRHLHPVADHLLRQSADVALRSPPDANAILTSGRLAQRA
ncbi:hypothetical protein K402DRAFT_425165 [Aulographum hederae CBS 113979]|uniref:Uncharacterized protein n=1 Tax=Aulographum hederae CBS 113979 TaxID=1176131 RepID=A0A6G1GLR4_9PEZI|nr:hypothetical protein K402DRAFT_425165 [Aulographum hederae CBS 113979]